MPAPRSFVRRVAAPALIAVGIVAATMAVPGSGSAEPGGPLVVTNATKTVPATIHARVDDVIAPDGSLVCPGHLWVEFEVVPGATAYRLSLTDNTRGGVRVTRTLAQDSVSWDTPTPNPGFHNYALTIGGGSPGSDPDCSRIRESFLRNQLARYSDPEIEVDYDPVENEPPSASFTITPSGGPGSFQAVSTATDPDTPDGDVLSYSWAWGDGSPASQGAAASHTYATPGTYTVTHTVVDSHGESSVATRSVEVAAPQLGLAISLPDEPTSALEPGATTRVRLTVSAGSGVGDLSALAFDGDPLHLAPTTLLTVTGGPTPAVPSPFVLAPDGSATFDLRVKAGDVGGVTALSSRITGKDAAGRTVTANASTNVAVAVSSLKVTITADPDEVTLEETPAGPKPKRIAVTVEVENLTDDPIDGVRLPADLTLSSRDDEPPEPFPLEQVGDSEERVFDLDAKGTHTESFELEATDDGRFRIRTVATAPDPNGGATLREQGTGDLDVIPAVLLWFDAEKVVTSEIPGLPVSGEVFDIEGVVENRSTTKAIQLDLLFPELSGNAGGGTMRRLGTPSPCACPFPLFGQLEPGEKVEFATQVVTADNGGTRGTVHFAPKGEVVERDGTTPEIPADKIRTSDDIVLSLDDSADPPADPSTLGSGIASFSVNVFEHAVAIFTLDPVQVLGTVGTFSGQMLQRLPDAADTGARFARAVMNTYAMASAELLVLDDDPAARQRFFTETRALFDKELTKELGLTSADIDGAVNQAIDNVLLPFARAWDTGNYDQAMAILGGIGGDLADLGAIGKALKVAGRGGFSFLAQPRFRGVLTLAERTAKASGAKFVDEALRNLKVGERLGDDVLRESFGVAAETVANLKRLAKEKGLLIGIRFRNPRSLYWIEQRGAMLKPEALKLKNVDTVDVAFLGYKPDDLGSVVFKKPDDLDTVLGRLDAAGASEAERAAAIRRQILREEEWVGKYGNDVREYAKPLSQGGGIPMGFNYVDNGIGSDIRATTFKKQGFFLRETPAGSGYFEVYMADSRGIPRRVTGDIDLVDIRKSNGLALSLTERADVYDVLADLMGLQHPETMTWLQKATSEVLWGTKAGLLADHTLDGAREFVAQFAPDGIVRAVLLDAKLTWFDPGTKASFAWWVGGYRTVASDLFTHGAITVVKPFIDSIPKKFFPPASWRLSEATRAAEPPFDRYAFSNAPTAEVLQPDDAGGLQGWTVDRGWQPADVPALFTAGGGAIAVRPQTALTAAVPAGSTELPINELVDLAPGHGADPWFRVGQTVVIDPGGPNQEVGTIRGFGSILLADPTTVAHAPGELVTATPDGTDPTAITTTTTPTTTAPPTASNAPPGSTVGEGELARTGSPIGALAGLGITLLVAGVVLRRLRLLGRPTPSR